MTSQQLHEFARLGAEARLRAIAEEREAILRTFPQLRDGAAPSSGAPSPAAPRVRGPRRVDVGDGAQGGRRAHARLLGQATGRESGRVGAGQRERLRGSHAACQAQRHVSWPSGSSREDASLLGGQARRKAGRRAQASWPEGRAQEVARPRHADRRHERLTRPLPIAPCRWRCYANHRPSRETCGSSTGTTTEQRGMVCGPLFVERPDALRVRHVDHEPTIVRPILQTHHRLGEKNRAHVLIDCPFVHTVRGAERDFTAIRGRPA